MHTSPKSLHSSTAPPPPPPASVYSYRPNCTYPIYTLCCTGNIYHIFPALPCTAIFQRVPYLPYFTSISSLYHRAAHLRPLLCIIDAYLLRCAVVYLRFVHCACNYSTCTLVRCLIRCRVPCPLPCWCWWIYPAMPCRVRCLYTGLFLAPIMYPRGRALRRSNVRARVVPGPAVIIEYSFIPEHFKIYHIYGFFQHLRLACACFFCYFMQFFPIPFRQVCLYIVCFFRLVSCFLFSFCHYCGVCIFIHRCFFSMDATFIHAAFVIFCVISLYFAFSMEKHISRCISMEILIHYSHTERHGTQPTARRVRWYSRQPTAARVRRWNPGNAHTAGKYSSIVHNAAFWCLWPRSQTSKRGQPLQDAAQVKRDRVNIDKSIHHRTALYHIAE